MWNVLHLLQIQCNCEIRVQVVTNLFIYLFLNNFVTKLTNNNMAVEGHYISDHVTCFSISCAGKIN